MISVNTNRMALDALQYLRDVQAQKMRVEKRVATGNRVEDATDGGAAFALAQGGRSESAAIGALRDRQAHAQQILSLAIAGGTAISDELTKLKADVVQLGGLYSDEQKAEIRRQIERRLQQVTSFAENAGFQGTNPLVPPPDAINFGATAAGGAGVTTNTFNLPPGARGIVLVEYDMFGVPDEAEILIDGAVAATTGGPVSGRGAIRASYQGSAGDSFDVRITGPVGTGWNYEASFLPVWDIPRDTGGGRLAAEYRLMRAADLDLDAAALDGSQASLQAVDEALARVAGALNYFGGLYRSVTNFLSANGVQRDATDVAVGAVVDADMARESARLQSSQVREQLAAQGLSLAVGQPNRILDLFA